MFVKWREKMRTTRKFKEEEEGVLVRERGDGRGWGLDKAYAEDREEGLKERRDRR